ncbi:hypothetical protein BS47DRAFT_1347835 [Hydnum rufescens UP504]|uniref:Uncharacterized protein n=1 Tax=Hydnum rufescens UP504 TaxID=1448309 RepID=A0A9P6DTF9_9AGAM|nr:hypothetical protein BS47DRAFT_1347835 [Hydnum rufescens UP504]
MNPPQNDNPPATRDPRATMCQTKTRSNTKPYEPRTYYRECVGLYKVITSTTCQTSSPSCQTRAANATRPDTSARQNPGMGTHDPRPQAPQTCHTPASAGLW